MKEKPVNTPIRKNTRKELKKRALDFDMTIVDYLDHVLWSHWRHVDELKAQRNQRETDTLRPSDRAVNAYAELKHASAAEAEARGGEDEQGPA